jgi:hypothetical protein
MLDAAPAGVARLDHVERGGDVPRERDAAPPRVVGEREVRLARQSLVHREERAYVARRGW